MSAATLTIPTGEWNAIKRSVERTEKLLTELLDRKPGVKGWVRMKAITTATGMRPCEVRTARLNNQALAKKGENGHYTYDLQAFKELVK